MHDTHKKLHSMGWAIFAFNNLIFSPFTPCFAVPCVSFKGKHRLCWMILHNKQIHPQQRKLAVRAFHEFPIREESVEQHSNRHISSVECLFEHQSIHLIFWFRCVTRAPRFTVIHNTPIGSLRIYTSPFAYSINVCATVDSLFCHFTSYNSFSAARRAARGWKKVEKNKHRLTYTTQSLSFRSHFCCCFIAEDFRASGMHEICFLIS